MCEDVHGCFWRGKNPLEGRGGFDDESNCGPTGAWPSGLLRKRACWRTGGLAAWLDRRLLGRVRWLARWLAGGRARQRAADSVDWRWECACSGKRLLRPAALGDARTLWCAAPLRTGSAGPHGGRRTSAPGRTRGSCPRVRPPPLPPCGARPAGDEGRSWGNQGFLSQEQPGRCPRARRASLCCQPPRRSPQPRRRFRYVQVWLSVGRDALDVRRLEYQVERELDWAGQVGRLAERAMTERRDRGTASNGDSKKLRASGRVAGLLGWRACRRRRGVAGGMDRRRSGGRDGWFGGWPAAGHGTGRLTLMAGGGCVHAPRNDCNNLIRWAMRAHCAAAQGQCGHTRRAEDERAWENPWVLVPG